MTALEAIQPAAEAVLSRTWGDAVRLGAGDNLGGHSRAAVYRCRVLSGPPRAPATVVLKCPHDAGGRTTPTPLTSLTA